MQLDHEFTVPATVDEAWAVLLDVPRIAPCMPGATLTEVDGDAFSGTVKVKLGPISLLYRGKGRFVDTDDATHRLVMEASGKESRGSGTAAATITATLSAGENDTTDVHVTTDLKITGRPAQFGRGMLDDVGAKLLGQFAECLASTLAVTPAGAGPTEAAGAGASTRDAPTTRSAPSGAAAVESGFAAGDDRVFGSADDEAIDLLEITGLGVLIRRYGPLALVLAVVAALVWWARRRRSP